MPTKTTFSYKNYLKPSPDNLQYLASSLKAITLVIAGSAWANGNPHVGMIVMIIGASLDEISKFFAKISHDLKEENDNKKDETPTTPSN